MMNIGCRKMSKSFVMCLASYLITFTPLQERKTNDKTPPLCMYAAVNITDHAAWAACPCHGLDLVDRLSK